MSDTAPPHEHWESGAGSSPADAFLGIPYRRLERLLAPVTQPAAELHGESRGRLRGRDGDNSHHPLAATFARGALTTIIEPGDTDAHHLLEALGPADTLRAIAEGWEARQVMAFVAGAWAGENREPSGARSEVTQATHATDATEPVDGGGWLWSSALGTPVRKGMAPEEQAVLPATDAQESAEKRRAVRRLDEALTRWRGRLSQAAAIRAFESAAHLGASLITPESAHWPTGLAALDEGEPLALWVRGDVERLSSLGRSIALVGARAATGYGEHVAMESAAGLGARGFAIVSGGAYGIDGAAHRAALAAGRLTIAFLAGGVDRLYPAGHSDLLRRVADTGALIGELPCGSTPTRWRFLMRNRLIAAVSNATVVVEAGHRSGSLNTAGHASQMGRPLGAVPGPVTSPASAGCHRLIREYAATCVTTVDEMAELAGPLIADLSPAPGMGGGAQALAHPAGSIDDRVLAALHRTVGTRTAEVAARTGLSSQDVHAALGRLEATGSVVETQDRWFGRGRA
jgi:DNA processing protein